jgi:hypothetical protein
MNAKEFKEYILQHMTADEALEKLLATTVQQFDNLKANINVEGQNHESASPYLIIMNAAMDLGWNIAVEDPNASPVVRGIVVGTEAYLNKLFEPEERVKALEEGNRQNAIDYALYCIQNNVLPLDEHYNVWFEAQTVIRNGSI